MKLYKKLLSDCVTSYPSLMLLGRLLLIYEHISERQVRIRQKSLLMLWTTEQLQSKLSLNSMLNNFTSSYWTVRKVSGTNKWTVCEPFFWYIGDDTNGKRIVVEQGFTTDFGSIPSILWIFINPTEWNSFIVHDKAYEKHITTRKQADNILFQALIVEGCWFWKAYAIYVGVRLFWWLYY